MGHFKTSSVVFFALSTGMLSADICLPFPVSVDLSVNADSFRSLPDGSWINNDGAYVGLNIGLPVPELYSEGLGIQLGASWGAYDWNGRESAPFGNPRTIQQQIFMTGGLFWKWDFCDEAGINAGVVYDWSINKYLGAYGLQANAAQVRYQTGFLWNGYDEFGIWGANSVFTAHRKPAGVAVDFKTINQISFFWQHTFENCGYAMLWVGLPYGRGLLTDRGWSEDSRDEKKHRPGEFLVGARMGSPLSSGFSIEGHASYMHPTSLIKGEESQNYAFNVSIGITYSFGETVFYQEAGVRPYLPLADNSNFILDTRRNY